MLVKSTSGSCVKYFYLVSEELLTTWLLEVFTNDLDLRGNP